MMHKDLFRQILIDPAVKGAHLRIVSGFASANMADKHMEFLKELESISIELIVGMTVQHGIQKAQHLAFCKLVDEKPYGINFKCRYIVNGNPVHAKSYVWIDEHGNPQKAFCGSANYTALGFGKSQIESMTTADPIIANEFHDYVLNNSAVCNQSHIDTQVRLLLNDYNFDESDFESVTLSLLSSRGVRETPARSGINWGQREGREHNQAYINIPKKEQQSKFFPERGEQFTVLTDDGDSFIFVRAQDAGKALETTQNNSLLGEYLRARLEVAPGEYVEKKHLVKYGRTSVTFFKIDDETYFMDFRPNSGPGDDIETWAEK